jgi:hypothetical protein
MKEFTIWLIDFIFKSLLQEGIVIVAGVLVAFLIQKYWIQWRYGKWHVILLRGGTEILNRDISPRKAKEILEEDSDLSVFLKGVISPYEWINCDLIEELKKKDGMLEENRAARNFIVHLDKNPSPNKGVKAG